MDEPIQPDGQQVRRRRHERAWSPRDLIRAIGDASERASGLRQSISPNLLQGIEERDEIVPARTLEWLASGLGCDPIDITKDPEQELDPRLLPKPDEELQ